MDAVSGPVRSRHTVGAALNTVSILRYLGSVDEPVRLVRIAGDLGLLPSTCLNILRTLADEDMVVHHKAAKTYEIGTGVLAIAENALMRARERDRIQPLLDAFSRRNAVSVILWRRIADRELVVIAHSAVGARIQILPRVGIGLPLLSGSMGRVVAGFADLDEARLRSRFAEVSWQGSIDFETFMAESRAARIRGWATDNGTMHGTHHGMSAPIPTHDPVQRIIGAALFADQFTAEQGEAIGHDLMALAAALAGTAI